MLFYSFAINLAGFDFENIFLLNIYNYYYGG